MFDLLGLMTPLLVAAVAANLYVALYATRPWWTTGPGRALMVLAVGTTIVLNLFAASIIWGDYPGREPIRAVGLWLFAAGMWWLLGVLVRIVVRERRAARE